MNALTVDAKIIGQTSCGFVTGRKYRIKITTSVQRIKPFFSAKQTNWLWVFDTCGAAKCPYASIKLLAANWEIPINSETEQMNPISNRVWGR